MRPRIAQIVITPCQSGGDGVITITQVFDALHRTTARIDDRENPTGYVFDVLDRIIRQDYADGTFETWDYNADSEVQFYVDQNGSKQTYSYDPEGRVTVLEVDNSLANASVVGTTRKEFYYSDLGDLWITVDDNGFGTPPPADHEGPNDPRVISKTFRDSLRRTICEAQFVDGSPHFVLSEYQGASRLVRQTYPDGRVVARSYDPLDRLTQIRDFGTNGATTPVDVVTTDFVGPWRKVLSIYGNGARLDKRSDPSAGPQQTVSGVDAGYDSNRRDILHRWMEPGTNPTAITSYRSSYNGIGGIGTNRQNQEVLEHLGTTNTWEFDSAYRMKSFDRGGVGPSTRTLDGVDRMLSFFDEGTDRGPAVDNHADPAENGLNQYSEFDGGVRVHDDNGNRISDGLGTREFRFDAFNRLTHALDASGVAEWVYSYDAAGRIVRREECATGATTRYTYSGWRVVQETEATQTLQYIDGMGIDEHIQLKKLDFAAGTIEHFYYHCNRQGFVGAITDESADVVEYYDYSMLGRPRIQVPDGSGGLTEASRVVQHAFCKST